MANRIVIALVGVAGGAALAILGPAPMGKPRIDPKSVADEVDGRLREAAAGLHSRVTTLAEIPRLAAAVSTDVTTVRDLTTDELAFRPKPGEVISIGQLPTAKGAKAVVLLTLPDGAKGLPLDLVGSQLRLLDGKLNMYERVTVVPKARADELTGALAIAWPLDAAPLVERLDRDGAAVSFELADGKVALGSHTIVAGEPTTKLQLTTPSAKDVRLVVYVPLEPAPFSPFWIAGGALAALSLLAAALAGRKKPAAAAATSAEPDFLAQPTNKIPSIERVSTTQTGRPNESSISGATVAGDPSTTHVGRYEIVRKLGSGGMAEVYLARASGEAGFTKLIALKVLHRNLASEAIVVEHFLDEARLASRLTHPNIVQITDLGKAGDEYFIAMEYIEGSDLERLLGSAIDRGEFVPLRVALAILRKICDGLNAAHIAVDADGRALDLVHRDVKSANVFIARNGAVKVGDFGIAKANIETRQNKTQAGMVKGTAAYMAPEQRVGKPTDKRADLYAVGAIAYELLSGQEVNLDLAMLADRGREGWPHLPKPSTLRAEIPPEIDAILWKCLAYEAADRYANCAELEEAFEKVAASIGGVVGEKAIAAWVEHMLGRAPTGTQQVATQ